MRRFISLLLLSIALLLIVPIHATTPTLMTGNVFGEGGSKVTTVRLADNITFLDVTGGIGFTGGIHGDGTGAIEITFHNSTGVLKVSARIAFSGTVGDSKPGSMDISLVGTETTSTTNPGIGFGRLTSIDVRAVLSDGTGGLTGIHGEGSFGLGATSITYSVLVHFDPA